MNIEQLQMEKWLSKKIRIESLNKALIAQQKTAWKRCNSHLKTNFPINTGIEQVIWRLSHEEAPPLIIDWGFSIHYYTSLS